MKYLRRALLALLLLSACAVASAAVGVRQELVGSLSSAATTVSVTFSATPLLAGDCLDVFVVNNSSNGTPTVVDGGDAFTQVGSTIINSSSATRRLIQFVACNIAGGAVTVTATQSSSQNQFLLDAREISGTAGLDSSGTGTPAGQYQSAPGTGTNAITTGSGAGDLTPTTQPGLISGFAYISNPGGVNSAGTGFTVGVNEVSPGSISGLILSESLRYTATTALPATFTTNGSSATSVTLAALFIESAPSPNAVYNQLPLSVAVAYSGAQFSVPSGCGTVSGLTGGFANLDPVGHSVTGSFLAGQTACAAVITMPTGMSVYAKDGWVCGSLNDLTTPADGPLKQTAYTTASATISGTVVTGDQITFVCHPM